MPLLPCLTKAERPEGMSEEDFAREHKRLLRVLKSPGRKDDDAEFQRQAEEVREKLPPEKAAEVIGKAHHGPSTRVVNGQLIQVAAYDDRRFTHSGKGNPEAFTFTEKQQNRTEQVKDLFPGDEYFPIVTVDDGGYTIIDGHNRAAVAMERGHEIPYVAITKKAFDDLKGKGFDNMEIAWAALTAEGESDAAEAINQQFPGARVAERGEAAVDILHHSDQPVVKAENTPHPSPTDAQRRAGNYRKAHWRIHGLDVTIENLAGSQREGVDESGKPWAVTLPYHYGYIRGTKGADGDHVDCMVGPLHDKGTEVTIINQKVKGGTGFDEHKVMIGYPSREQALAAFCHGRDDDPREVMGHAITVPVEEFLRWVAEGNHQEATVLKAETVAKAEGKVHVKSHFRNVNGKIVYIPDYDKAVHGDHPEATLHQRTIHKQTKHGHTLQVFDSEDNEKVKEAMDKLGIQPKASQHTGATHHGVKKSVFQHHFEYEAQAQAVHHALAAGEPEATPAPEPKVFADQGPETGPDTKAKQDKEAIADAEHAIGGIAFHFGDPNAGDGVHYFDTLKTEAYANIETGLQHGASKVWAANMETQIRDAWKVYIFQMLPGQGEELEALDGPSFANRIANGITTQGQIEILGDIAGAAALVAEVNAVADPADGDGQKIGHAYKEALAVEGWASDLDQIMAKGKPKYLPNVIDPITGTEALAKIRNEAVEVMDYFVGHHENMNKAYMSGKINATKTQGYVPPAFHDIAIKSREALMAFHKAAGNDYEAQTQENLLHNAHAAKHESQKMHDYVNLDADALVSGPSPQGMTAQNAAKLAAVSFQMKAKAANATGNGAMASHYINKAKAAATVALTLAGK